MGDALSHLWYKKNSCASRCHPSEQCTRDSSSTCAIKKKTDRSTQRGHASPPSCSQSVRWTSNPLHALKSCSVGVASHTYGWIRNIFDCYPRATTGTSARVRLPLRAVNVAASWTCKRIHRVWTTPPTPPALQPSQPAYLPPQSRCSLRESASNKVGSAPMLRLSAHGAHCCRPQRFHRAPFFYSGACQDDALRGALSY